MNNQDSECPCVDCLLISMCKSITVFSLYDLMNKCDLVKGYLINYDKKIINGYIHFQRYTTVVNILKIENE